MSQAAGASEAGKCSRCLGSTCCTYTTEALGTLRSKADFEHALWQISHEHVEIYRDNSGWYLLVRGNCEHLQDDGHCGIYSHRPQICRDYDSDSAAGSIDWHPPIVLGAPLSPLSPHGALAATPQNQIPPGSH